jgi:hypothetical protein
MRERCSRLRSAVMADGQKSVKHELAAMGGLGEMRV